MISKPIDIKFYHFILKVLPVLIPKYGWGWICSSLFLCYIYYARFLRPLLFGTPSERFIEYSWAIKRLKKDHSRILDIGCGDSLFDCRLAYLGYDVFAIDLLSQKANIKANYNFFQGSIVCPPFKEGKFDKIHALSSIEHIDEGQPGISVNQLTSMTNMCHLINECGSLILTMPLGDYPGSCNLNRFENLKRIALENNMMLNEQEFYIANGRKWDVYLGDEALTKIKPILNKEKVISCLSFTKKR